MKSTLAKITRIALFSTWLISCIVLITDFDLKIIENNNLSFYAAWVFVVSMILQIAIGLLDFRKDDFLKSLKDLRPFFKITLWITILPVIFVLITGLWMFFGAQG